MSKAIADAIYAKLGSDTSAGSFHASVGGRYYHIESEEGAEVPLCIYAVSEPATPEMHFDSKEYETWRFAFVVYVSRTASGNPDVEAMTIDGKLRTLLHNAALTVTGYAGVKAVCERSGFCSADGSAMQVESVYRIFGARA